MDTASRESLVARIIAGQAWRLNLGPLDPGDPHGAHAAEQELVQSMRGKQPFRARGDLSEWIFARTATAVRAGRRPDDPNLVAEITARLETPESPFDFAVEFTNNSMESYRLELTPDLTLTVTTDYDESSGAYSPDPARLEGRVHAYSSTTALDESCRVIREVVGAFLAVGLAGPFRTPGDPAGEFHLGSELQFDGFGDPPAPPGEIFDLRSKVEFHPCMGTSFDEARASRAAGQPGDRLRNQITRLWQGPPGRSQEIRTACGLYARAQVASDPGVAIVNYSMCLEWLLLQRSDNASITARLSEAIAYRLGRSADDRERLRKTIRDLYAVRSQYVHTVRVQPDLELGEQWARIAGDALRREIEDF